MAKIDLNKHIWEGWTVGAFIDDLQQNIQMIMGGNSWQKPFKTKAELKAWCMSNQPGYKKYVPDVVNYFAEKYSIK